MNDLRMTAKTKIAYGTFIIIVIIYVLYLLGLHSKIQTWVASTDYSTSSQIAQKLSGRDDAENTSAGTFRKLTNTTPTDTPPHLMEAFPKTDFGKTDPNIVYALSGGPGKDGIPALTNPTMEPIANFAHPDAVQAIVLFGESSIRVYPYNILTWHEIINDTIDNKPVMVTFCPLCGSAIAFDRTLSDGTVAEFGVSGSLLDSNMIMYDRGTESLWQQSTGRTLAGSLYPSELIFIGFQLMSIGEVKERYPTALVVSEQTGHVRDYGRNPYAGYETNNRFLFEPRSFSDQFTPKEMMVVFRLGDTPIAIAWRELLETRSLTDKIQNENITVRLTEENKVIIESETTQYPFYYEMWFSFSAQHGDSAFVLSHK